MKKLRIKQNLNKILVFALLILIATFSQCDKNEVQPLKGIDITTINSSYRGSLFDVYFLDEQNGYAVADYNQEKKKTLLLKTIDGGDHWALDTFQIASVRINTLTGYGDKLIALGTSQELGNNNPDHVYSSNDHGLTWAISPDFLYGYPLFFDNSKVIRSSIGGIYYSTDGGKTWLKTLENNSLGRANAFQIKGKSTAYVAGGASYDFTNFGFFYNSVDNGLTWQRNSKNFKNIVGMHFIDESIGYVFEDLHEGSLTSSSKEGTAIYKTSDGGVTWVKRNADLKNFFMSCYFFNQSEGLYSNLNSFYFTNDEGQNWHLQFQKDNASIRKIYFINTHIGLAVGDAGLILKLKR